MNLSTSPPAALTARIVASLSLRWRSCISFSRRAFVLLDPDGATPVISTFLSLGVKFTNPIVPDALPRGVVAVAPPPISFPPPPPPPPPMSPPKDPDDVAERGVCGSWWWWWWWDDDPARLLLPLPPLPPLLPLLNDRRLRTEMELDRCC